MDRQVGEVLSAWEDLGPTRSLRCTEQPAPPPAEILEIVTELGLRYPPANSVDREAHAARVALLAKDCADLNPRHLRQAVDAWAKEEPFLPRACELRAKVKALDYAAEVRRRGRALPPPPPAPLPEPPPLTDAEIAGLSGALLRMALKTGAVTAEQHAAAVARVRA